MSTHAAQTVTYVLREGAGLVLRHARQATRLTPAQPRTVRPVSGW